LNHQNVFWHARNYSAGVIGMGPVKLMLVPC
jgi:hypothetical protein